MTYEVKWHRALKELPVPYANCYLVVQAEPTDLEFTVVMGHYNEAADVFVDISTNTNIPVESVWYWTARLTPWVDEAKR